MSDLQKLKDWIGKSPYADILQNMRVDYTDSLPGEFGIFPAGLTEISRERYIDGDMVVNNQYNFAIYTVFEKAPGDDAGALINADWLMDFQRWVQQESIMHRAPTFGNVAQDEETIRAQNGVLYDADNDGLAMYMVQLTATFQQYFESED